MFNFCSLYSGSSGNCLFVETDKTKILIDAGVSQRKILDALASFNVDISEIDAILVTHEHSDHTKNLGALSQKYNIEMPIVNAVYNVLYNGLDPQKAVDGLSSRNAISLYPRSLASSSTSGEKLPAPMISSFCITTPQATQ